MAEENKVQELEKKEEKAEEKIVEKTTDKVEEGKETVREAEKEIAEKIGKEAEKLETKKEEIKEKAEETVKTKQDKTSQASESKPGSTSTTDNKDKPTKSEEKVITKPKVKRTEAVVNGRSLPVSTKHAIAICNFIKNKDIDWAIIALEQVEKKKKAVPMRGEIPHRKGKGMMSGRYPVKAAGEFIRLLKSLKANAIVNELELEKCKLACMSNVAARQYRRFGRGRFKRTHVQLKLVPITKKKSKEVKK